MAYDGDENAPDKMQQGSAWSESPMHDFVCRASAPSPPLTLTIHGSDEEIRQYLDGPRLDCVVEDLDAELREKLKYGHTFQTADEAMEWVRVELAECYEGSGGVCDDGSSGVFEDC